MSSIESEKLKNVCLLCHSTSTHGSTVYPYEYADFISCLAWEKGVQKREI